MTDIHPDIHAITASMLTAAIRNKRYTWAQRADFLPTLFFQRDGTLNILGITGEFDQSPAQWAAIREKIAPCELAGFVSDAYMKRVPVGELDTLQSWVGSEDPSAVQAIVVITVSKQTGIQVEMCYRVGDRGELVFDPPEQTDIGSGVVVSELRKAVGVE